MNDHISRAKLFDRLATITAEDANDMKAKIYAVIQSMETEPEQEPEWIPCSRQLPETGIPVLIFVDEELRLPWEEKRTIEFGKIDPEEGWMWLDESANDYWAPINAKWVLAWQPLPEKYKKKETEPDCGWR